MATSGYNTHSRRTFLKISALGGAGFALGFHLPTLSAVSGATAESSELNAFVSINSDNTVTVMIKHLEFGQGTFTGLSTLVAEELDADWSQLRAEHAPADAARYNNLHFGPMQGTGGSNAIANSYDQLRKAGAAARHMLVNAAAESWQVRASEITVSNGVIHHDPSGRRGSFGEFAERAARQPVPELVSLKQTQDFHIIGTNPPRKDQGKTDGSAIFTQDINLPGQLTALVAHPPRFGAVVKSYDDAKTRALPGIVKVLAIPTGIAVLARDYWTAKKGRDLLVIDWDESRAFNKSSTDIMQGYKQRGKEPGITAVSRGDIGRARAGASRTIEAEFELPFLAHAPLEPMDCVVLINDEGCEIWNGCQSQTLDQNMVAGVLGIKPAQVKINTLFAGGSFGRRGNTVSDYVVEATTIASQLDQGIPVKLVWSREDDMRAGYFRPMYYHRIEAGLDDNNNVSFWHHRIVGQSIGAGTPFEFLIKDGIDRTSVEGAVNLPYQVPNFQVELHTPDDIKVPVLWWRSVGSTHNAFSTEVMIDQLAITAGVDPLAFRLQLLKDKPRHRAVLELAAQQAAWGSPLPEGTARGIAVHSSFHSFVAQVAEISLQDGGGFSVDRVVCAVDCGVAVNPDIIRAQMEGGIGYGLSAALMSEITLDAGRVKQSNFHDYQVLRISDMPDIEVHIIQSDAAPTGVGEPATPVIAPAVANALFAATGRRQFKLPLRIT